MWDVYIPHSIKFSRDKIFVEINFTDEGFSLAMPTTPSSAAHFQIQVFLLRGKLRLEPSLFRSLELINYNSQAGDACPLTNAVDIEGTYEGGFETMIECHVALDVHAIVQKGNSYCFVSRPYHKLPSNLVEKNLISRYRTNP